MKYRVYGTYLESLHVDVEADSEGQAEIIGQDLMNECIETSVETPTETLDDGEITVIEIEEIKQC